MSRGGRSWLKMFSFICIIALAFLAYDCHLHGSFEKSATATYLNEWGVLPYLDKTTYKARKQIREVWKELQERAPVYYNKAKTYSAPYLKIFGEQLRKVYDYLWELLKPLRLWLDKNVPIFIAKVKKEYLPQLILIAQAIITRLQEVAVIVVNVLIDFFTEIWRWLIENVLIGSWSPENIREVVLNCLEATQFYFSQAFQWITDQIKAHVA